MSFLLFTPSGASKLLDGVTTPIWAAYGLSLLKSDYAGAAIRVKDALNAEEDIGFTAAGDLDVAALSGDDPYKIITVYDQSGNGRNATAIATVEPLLDEVEVAISFLPPPFAVAGVFSLPDISALTSGEAFMRRKLGSSPPAAGGGGWWYFGTGAGSSHTPFNDSKFYDHFGSTARKDNITNSESLTAWHVYSAWSASNDWACRVNNVELFTTGTNTVGFTTTPFWGEGINNGLHTTVASGFSTGLIIFSQKCNSTDRAAVIAGM